MANQTITEGASETPPGLSNARSSREVDTYGVHRVKSAVVPEATAIKEDKKVMIVEPDQDNVGDDAKLTTVESETQADARELDGDLEVADTQVGPGKAKKRKKAKPKSKRGLVWFAPSLKNLSMSCSTLKAVE